MILAEAATDVFGVRSGMSPMFEPAAIFGYAIDMSSAAEDNLTSVRDYLSGEATAKRKHEYVDGVIYAMVGASNSHNRIATNATGSLHSQLRGKPCEVFNSDTKVRVRTQRETRFYYPDCLVVCHPNPPGDSFQDDPAVIIEVLSESTRRVDEFEKRDAYLSIPRLSVYVLLEQSTAVAGVYRRADNGFKREIYRGMDATIDLPEVGCRLPLADAYDRVEFIPRPADEEASG